MKKMLKLTAVLVAALVCMSAYYPMTYLERLLSYEGTDYFKLNCQTFIEAAHGTGLHCSAAKMWDGCYDQATVVAEFASLESINLAQLAPGDVLDFHGTHVAAYIGGTDFMDSDVCHGGVGHIDLRQKSNDFWFKGSVRVLRWKIQVYAPAKAQR
jgi:hypothetical protein